MWFQVTKNTKALYLHNQHYYKTEILEDEETVWSTKIPIDILNRSCLMHGSSLRGREAFSRSVLKTNSKLPILIDPQNAVYMFPTLSKRNKHCVWLSYYQIYDYKSRDNRTLIIFKDGTFIYVRASLSSIDSQFKKTSQLIAQLNSPTYSLS